jgi:hypothetical protein
MNFAKAKPLHFHRQIARSVRNLSATGLWRGLAGESEASRDGKQEVVTACMHASAVARGGEVLCRIRRVMQQHAGHGSRFLSLVLDHPGSHASRTTASETFLEHVVQSLAWIASSTFK